MSADPLALPVRLSLRSRSERELVALAQRGDRDAFGALVGAHETTCLRAAFLVTRSQADAEDTVQEAFLRAYRALGTFRAGEPFRPWIVRIVRNEACERVRRRRRDALVEARSRAAAVATIVPGADVESARADEGARVRRALTQLDEDDRLAIGLRFFADLPDAESAEVLGVTPGAFRVRVFRALGRLRVLMVAAVLAAIALGALVASPTARSALAWLLESIPGVTAERVVQLEPMPLDVAPPFLGMPATTQEAVRWSDFDLRLPAVLPRPDAYFVRNDVEGGVVTAVWSPAARPRATLTEWRTLPRAAQVQVVGATARVSRTSVDGEAALWVEGAGRATYTVVGADGELHREAFFLSANVLFWSDEGTAFRLEVATSQEDAIAIAESVD